MIFSFQKTKFQHSVPELVLHHTQWQWAWRLAFGKMLLKDIDWSHIQKFAKIIFCIWSPDHITFWSHLLVHHVPLSAVPAFCSHFHMLSLFSLISPFLLLTTAAPTPAKASSGYFRATSQNCFHTFLHICVFFLCV